jgi:hypothetical protein
MPGGGNLTIRTVNVRLDNHNAAHHGLAAAGDYVSLAVQDTGTGIDDRIKGHIFEPFFTTKQPGEGTGLGLSTVYGIVKQSGGDITVRSTPGKGCEFRILFPAVPEPHLDDVADSCGERGTAGHETILLVEDEEMIRSLASTILTQSGYTVFDAVNGKEAIRMLDHLPSTLNLLITDLIMPEVSGVELQKTVSRRFLASRCSTCRATRKRPFRQNRSGSGYPLPAKTLHPERIDCQGAGGAGQAPPGALRSILQHRCPLPGPAVYLLQVPKRGFPMHRITFLLLLLCSSPAWGATLKLSLPVAFRIALQNSIEAKIAAHRVTQSRNELAAAGKIFSIKPFLSADAYLNGPDNTARNRKIGLGAAKKLPCGTNLSLVSPPVCTETRPRPSQRSGLEIRDNAHPVPTAAAGAGTAFCNTGSIRPAGPSVKNRSPLRGRFPALSGIPNSPYWQHLHAQRRASIAGISCNWPGSCWR